MTKRARARNVVGSVWTYLLRALEHPSRMPRTLRALASGAHPGHYFMLNAPWFREAGIRTVLDVGAHKGEFSSAIRALFPRARIYAFEPLPDCCAVLSNRMKNGGGFRAFPVAIGKTHEQITLWRSSYAKSSSALPMAALHKDSFPWSAENRPLTVQQSTLDEYLERLQLDDKVLLKIDVQGYEAQVLRGATELLKRVSCVLLEVSFRPLYEGQGTFAEIHGLLQAAGFSYAGNLEQLCSPVDDSILQADALFVREAS
jgi:FkbM family methyltransferase